MGVLELRFWGREGCCFLEGEGKRGRRKGLGWGKMVRRGKEWWCEISRWLGGWGWEIGGLCVDLEV